MDAIELALTNRPLGGPFAGCAIDRVREATHAIHRDLDETLHIVDRLSAMDQRVGLLAGYRFLYRKIEAKAACFLCGVAGLDFLARPRSALVTEGIRALGHPVSLDRPVSLRILTRAQALGALYVLEGSSLGGRTILKELKRRDVSLVGLDFLDPYGNRTGQRWKSFLTIFEREITSGEENADAVKGALDTFAFAKACLRKESCN
jgi:heme oxygenase (biliverdin-IX-beta and delta-forming)